MVVAGDDVTNAFGEEAGLRRRMRHRARRIEHQHVWRPAGEIDPRDPAVRRVDIAQQRVADYGFGRGGTVGICVQHRVHAVDTPLEPLARRAKRAG